MQESNRERRDCKPAMQESSQGKRGSSQEKPESNREKPDCIRAMSENNQVKSG